MQLMDMWEFGATKSWRPPNKLFGLEIRSFWRIFRTQVTALFQSQTTLHDITLVTFPFMICRYPLFEKKTIWIIGRNPPWLYSHQPLELVDIHHPDHHFIPLLYRLYPFCLCYTFIISSFNYTYDWYISHHIPIISIPKPPSQGPSDIQHHPGGSPQSWIISTSAARERQAGETQWRRCLHVLLLEGRSGWTCSEWVVGTVASSWKMGKPRAQIWVNHNKRNMIHDT